MRLGDQEPRHGAEGSTEPSGFTRSRIASPTRPASLARSLIARNTDHGTPLLLAHRGHRGGLHVDGHDPVRDERSEDGRLVQVLVRR